VTSYSRPSPRGMPDLADAWEPTMPDNESILSWEPDWTDGRNPAMAIRSPLTWLSQYVQYPSPYSCASSVKLRKVQ